MSVAIVAMRCLRCAAAIISATACATGTMGGEGGGGGAGGGGDTVVDASVRHDASTSSMPDAPPLTLDAALPDASVPVIDAAVPIDAPSGPFCTANNQCTVAGECCITLGGTQGFCGPGTVVLGECFPQ